MNKKIWIIALIVLVGLTSGCGKVPKLENGKDVIVSMNDKNFTANDLYNKLKEKYGTSILVSMIDDYIVSKEITDNTVALEYADAKFEEIKLQYEQYKEYGYNYDLATDLANAGFESEDAYIEYMANEYNKENLAKDYIKENIIKDSEINKYYKDEIFGELTAKHILIKPETTDEMTDEEKKNAETEAYNKAVELIKQLNEGADFEKLAKENSDDTGTAKDGGLFANFSKDEVVAEFWDASYKLEDGKYTTTPVKSEYGYHIILKVKANEKPALDEVKDDILDKLTEEKLNADSKLYTEVWNKIRESYNFKIEDSSINSNYNKLYK